MQRRIEADYWLGVSQRLPRIMEVEPDKRYVLGFEFLEIADRAPRQDSVRNTPVENPLAGNLNDGLAYPLAPGERKNSDTSERSPHKTERLGTDICSAEQQQARHPNHGK